MASLGSVRLLRRPRVTGRIWSVPAAYIVAALAGALVLPRLENAYLSSIDNAVAVGSAIAFFSAVGSGMIALTGVVFAIAFVMVQFGSAAYSPRLAIIFSTNPALYHTLGIFAATFIYSLAALVWTDRNGSGLVPVLSAALVVLLLIASMLALIRLIKSIIDLQIHNVLQVLGARGRAVIQNLFPAGEVDDSSARSADVSRPDEAIQAVFYSGRPLAITHIDIGALLGIAVNGDALVILECAVGDTVVEGTLLMRVYGPLVLAESELVKAVNLAVMRTFEQDPKYAIRLLVDIAIRALSPAINDPATAVQAIDQIEDLLRRLGRLDLDVGRVHDDVGVLRLVVPMPTWEDYLALGFDEIRHFGSSSIQVLRRLRAALMGLSDYVTSESRRDAVRRYIEHLNLGITRSAFDDQDRQSALQQDRQGLGMSRASAEPYLTDAARALSARAARAPRSARQQP